MNFAGVRFIGGRKLFQFAQKHADIGKSSRLKLAGPAHNVIVGFKRPLYCLSFHCQLVEKARSIEILYGGDIRCIGMLL